MITPQKTIAQWAIIGAIVCSLVAAYVASESHADTNQIVLSLLMTAVGFLYAFHVATTALSQEKQSQLSTVTVGRIIAVSAIVIVAVLISWLTSTKLYAIVVSSLLVLTTMTRRILTDHGSSRTGRFNELLLSKQIFLATTISVVCPTLIDFYFNYMNDIQTAYIAAVTIYSIIALVLILGDQQETARTHRGPRQAEEP